VKILAGEGIRVEEYDQFPAFAFAIPKAADSNWAWPILKNHTLAGPEIESLFGSIGLVMADLERLQA
jgi:hypothetical protein